MTAAPRAAVSLLVLLLPAAAAAQDKPQELIVGSWIGESITFTLRNKPVVRKLDRVMFQIAPNGHAKLFFQGDCERKVQYKLSETNALELEWGEWDSVEIADLVAANAGFMSLVRVCPDVLDNWLAQAQDYPPRPIQMLGLGLMSSDKQQYKVVVSKEDLILTGNILNKEDLKLVNKEDRNFVNMEVSFRFKRASPEGQEVFEKEHRQAVALKKAEQEYWLALRKVLAEIKTDDDLLRLKPFTKLKSLDLRNTRVTDKGLEHLKGLTNLGHLDLSGTRVTDQGMEHLKGLTNLNVLNLTETQITDKGLHHLRVLTKLRYLWLNGTKVTAKGVQDLEKALPNTSIGGP